MMDPQDGAAMFELDGERFVRPDFSGRGLANIAPTVLRLLAPRADQLNLPPLDESVLPAALTDGVRTVVLIVADGLGHEQLEREIAAGNAPHLGEFLQRAGVTGQDKAPPADGASQPRVDQPRLDADAQQPRPGHGVQAGDHSVAYRPITSVFPTTTVAALGSLNSGVTPVEHGLLGYTLYLREFDRASEMIRWGPLNRRISYSDAEFGCTPESFFWAETLYARLQVAGVTRAFAVNPAHFGGTALTRMLHQGAEYRGYIATSSVEPIVSRILSDDTGNPTYVYAYWPTVDTISHLVGPLTPEHSAEVAAFDAFFGRLLQRLPRRGDTLVMLTADHGHVVTQPERELPFAEHPALLEMLRVLPVGERRAVYLHPRPGADDEVLDYARSRLRSEAAVTTRDDAVRLGLFGPGGLSERAAARIGEVLLFPRSNLQFVTPVQMEDGTPMRVPAFRGLHGGLTAEEALVPLLAIRI